METRDLSTAKMGVGSNLILSSESPKNKLILIGLTLREIKWYEFWRWYLIPEFRRQVKQAHEDFRNTFGELVCLDMR